MAINAEKIMHYRRDPGMRDLLNNSIVTTPDGFGAVLGFKLLFGQSVIKLDLPKLMLEIANKHRKNMFFIGSSEESNRKAVETIFKRYPDIRIAGRTNGYFTSEETVINMIRRDLPDIVFVAMGTPRQEILSRRLSGLFPHALFIGCGGALDILSGKTKRAPRILVEYGLEWFYRLVRQPSRFFRQTVLIKFLSLLVLQAISNRIQRPD